MFLSFSLCGCTEREGEFQKKGKDIHRGKGREGENDGAYNDKKN